MDTRKSWMAWLLDWWGVEMMRFWIDQQLPSIPEDTKPLNAHQYRHLGLGRKFGTNHVIPRCHKEQALVDCNAAVIRKIDGV